MVFEYNATISLISVTLIVVLKNINQSPTSSNYVGLLIFWLLKHIAVNHVAPLKPRVFAHTVISQMWIYI